MISAIGFLAAVAAVSTLCFTLIMRAENKSLSRIRPRNGSSSSSYDGSSTSSNGDSWSFANSFTYSSEVSSSQADSSACTGGNWDSGSSDSGGDCGGGGDGGGGGGD